MRLGTAPSSLHIYHRNALCHLNRQSPFADLIEFLSVRRGPVNVIFPWIFVFWTLAIACVQLGRKCNLHMHVP
ncbi:hypothetical protein BDQ12DRAFT_268573 [Crucibulum laeve]|uniref:Uncharacterized protein n=1 Tax=Crucibulum laeve TaxID=68775 RepID=A0A5C3MA41_9AGAR|nr:hypothetical protein BDQ12DRAFT_268573 [Crucibulum laeve]